jgi:hypothetical protein
MAPSPLTLTITSQENLRPATTETLPDTPARLTAGQLITLRVLHQTATRPATEQAQAVEQALAAFRRGLYLLVVDDQRVADLDLPLTLDETTQVRFWRLLPLVGG